MNPITHTLFVLIPVLLISSAALAQSSDSEYELNPDGSWNQTQMPQPGTDAFVMADATRLLAEGHASKASKVLGKWLEKNKRTRNPYLAQAFTLRGEARLRSGSEYKALFDLETVIRDFSSSDYYTAAVELEYEIGMMYLGGLKRKFLGFRTDNARPTGEELLIRVQERLPGSALAERAALDLADHYFQRRELRLAAEMYSVFRENYPKSTQYRFTMLREIECSIARFKGPRYDGAGLVDAKLLIEEYTARYPAEAQRSGITEGMTSWIDESAAQQVLDTARWYLKTDDDFSAKFVLQRLVNRHPVTDAAQEAIELMLEHGWIERVEDPQPDPASNDASDTPDEAPAP